MSPIFGDVAHLQKYANLLQEKPLMVIEIDDNDTSTPEKQQSGQFNSPPHVSEQKEEVSQGIQGKTVHFLISLRKKLVRKKEMWLRTPFSIPFRKKWPNQA
jgi:hypothetical protein